MALTRREFLKWMSASAGAATLSACESPGTMGGGSGRAAARVVVVGGGYGGATAAKYVKMWAPDIEVTLIERDAHFISCPISNLVLGGNTSMQEITMGYETLRSRGVRVVRDEVIAIDPQRRAVRLSGGTSLDYDRLIMSPGVDYQYDQIPGLRSAEAQSASCTRGKPAIRPLHCASSSKRCVTAAFTCCTSPSRLFAARPVRTSAPARSPDYFKKAKPRSKILVLDSNPDLVSKKGLFLAAWEGLYKGMIEYRPNSELVDVDARSMTVKLQFDDVKGDVLNVVPPHRAADIAQKTGLLAEGQRWCAVDWLTAESAAVKGIHVIGDATLPANAMPKSASMANQHAKLCAAAVIALIKGEPVNPAPVIMNTCYSFVSGTSAMHVASVHQYDAAQKTLLPVKGAGGVSDKASELEATYAWGWARNIWSDTLA